MGPTTAAEEASRRRRRAWGAGARSGAAVAAVGLAFGAGCAPSAPNATAEGAARAFVELMARFDGDTQQGEELFAMLSDRGRNNLQTRAERYGAASGRTIAPTAMLVPDRVALRFSPRSYTAEVAGKFALVEVLGVRSDQRAQIPCVHEEGEWRVDVVLPDLPPLRVGPGRDL